MTSKYVRHHSRIRVGGKCPHWIIVFIYVHFPRKSKLCVDAFAVQSSSAMETPVVVISDSEDLPPSDAVHKKHTCIDLLNSISPASWLFIGNPAKRSRHSDAMWNSVFAERNALMLEKHLRHTTGKLLHQVMRRGNQ